MKSALRTEVQGEEDCKKHVHVCVGMVPRAASSVADEKALRRICMTRNNVTLLYIVAHPLFAVVDFIH